MDGYVTIGTELDTKSFDAQIDYVKSQLEEIEYKLKQADMGFEVGDTQKLEAQYEKLTDKLRNLVKKKEEFNQTKMIDFSGVKGSIDNVGKSITKATRRLEKMALAVFGIRSAFMFVRNSINTIAEGDEQLKADIDYMKIALAYTLEPIVRAIVDLAKQLMFYISYIVKAWTGRNIFENANKGLESSRKSAKGLNKELDKTVAGFDEMNTLSESTSKNSDDIVAPSFDLTAPENVDVPDWVKWIANHKQEIIDALIGIGTALLLIKLGLDGIKAFGIGLAIYGILETIKNIQKYLKKPIFKNFVGILEGIAITVAGVAIAFAAWPVAIGAAVALVVLEIVKHFDDIMKLFDDFIKWIDTDFRKWLTGAFGPFGDFIADVFKKAIEVAQGLFANFFGGIKKWIDGVMKLFQGDFVGGIKQIFSGILDILLAPFNALKDIVSSIFTGIGNIIIDMINTLIGALNSLSFKVPGWVPGVGGKKFGVNIGYLQRFGEPQYGGGGFRAKGGIYYPEKMPKLALGGIVNMPGSGVPYHGAYIGERGAEAVVPLTDSQQMSLLGETIGRYITVSLTNITQLDGRQIARKVEQIKQNNNFVLNR